MPPDCFGRRGSGDRLKEQAAAPTAGRRTSVGGGDALRESEARERTHEAPGRHGQVPGACASRNIRVGRALVDCERVHQYEGKADLDQECGKMYLPALFLYDQHGTSDFVQFFVKHTVTEHLANTFPEGGSYAGGKALVVKR
ncbi:hypothetical protein DVH05_001394 [Phytophthora capsici]|nr:hypothetical protein DVH05_005281 [Phytophthora capsici]KAG1706246.1 hypothetical protein DVH05_001394 [Phytophthora capsici]